MAHSPSLASFFKGSRPPELLFVDPAHLAELRQHLAWMGCEVLEKVI